jgi:hypothetical protein
MTAKKKTVRKRVASERVAKPYTVPAGHVLVMRTCAADLRSYNGFVWPESGPVECANWKPLAECGNGLHGLLWGAGDGLLLNWDADAKWLVVEVAAESIVDIGGKVKFPRGRVVYCGDRLSATTLIALHAPAGTSVVGGTATAGHRGAATAGDYGTATAGYGGTATAGYGGTATAGNRGTLSARYWDPKTERYRICSADVGDDGIEPNTAYVVDVDPATGRGALRKKVA